jgi:3alpha(or 20beta)-hydroxysteroid dehydrogenase
VRRQGYIVRHGSAKHSRHRNKLLPHLANGAHDMNLLDNKICLVTGAARGVGAAIATCFASAGATVIISDVIDEAGSEAATRIGASYRHLDVASDADWQAAAEAIEAQHGRLDVLVNNAAILHMGNIDHTRPEDMLRLFDVNAVGAYRGIRTFAPLMRRNGGGSIINIGSIDSLHGHNGLTAYCSSKWAMRGITKSAALELGRDGIRVNMVCPSSGNPGMFAPWSKELGAAAGEIQHYIADRAIPRGGELGEVANAALFLASALSSYCSGIDLPVDGGFTAGCFTPSFNAM